jgi:hypothetical protein
MALPIGVKAPQRIPLPDMRRLDMTQPWPAWLASRVNAVSVVDQKGPDGRYRYVRTFPAELMLSPAHAAMVSDHVEALLSLMAQTPENGAEFEKATCAAITKMMLALPTQKVTEVAAEARIEAFMMAVEDLPYWAVVAAIKGWYRGHYGNEHDYTWQPSPATLRRLAHLEAWKVASRIRELKGVIEAEELVTYSAEYCENMVERLKAVIPWFPFVGVGAREEPRDAPLQPSPEQSVAECEAQ